MADGLLINTTFGNTGGFFNLWPLTQFLELKTPMNRFYFNSSLVLMGCILFFGAGDSSEWGINNIIELSNV